MQEIKKQIVEKPPEKVSIIFFFGIFLGNDVLY